MGWKAWTTLILGVVSAFIAALFYIQNSLRKVDLSLDLGLRAWRLAEPVSVPLVLFVAFAVGLLLGLLAMSLAWRRASGRVAELELRLARASVSGSTGSAGAGGPSVGPSADLWT